MRTRALDDTAAAATTAAAGSERAAAGGPRGRRTAVLALLTLVLLLAARSWVAEPLRIPSESMSPTLRPGQHVLAEKVSRHVRSWQRGDIVGFESPADGALLVKRIVGLAGDRVAIRDGRLLVNGTRVHEPYADPDDIDSEFYGPVRVPVGEVLVLGDNRAESVDSRDFGTVPATDLGSRVIAVFWPLPDLELINNERDPS